jgi:hypothetical protein
MPVARRHPAPQRTFVSSAIKGSAQQDAFTKWVLLVAVMIVVDIVWLLIGLWRGGISLRANV